MPSSQSPHPSLWISGKANVLIPLCVLACRPPYVSATPSLSMSGRVWKRLDTLDHRIGSEGHFYHRYQQQDSDSLGSSIKSPGIPVITLQRKMRPSFSIRGGKSSEQSETGQIYLRTVE